MKRPGLPEIHDPEDQKFLVLATAGKADVVISGDDDLLVLGPRWERLLILSPPILKPGYQLIWMPERRIPCAASPVS